MLGVSSQSTIEQHHTCAELSPQCRREYRNVPLPPGSLLRLHTTYADPVQVEIGLLGQRGSFDPFAEPFGWQLIGKLAKNVHNPQKKEDKRRKRKELTIITAQNKSENRLQTEQIQEVP